MSAYGTPAALPPAPPAGVITTPGTSVPIPLPIANPPTPVNQQQPRYEDTGNISSASGDAYDDQPRSAGGKAPSRVSARRAQQNREAQRNFRERRKNYIKELEAKVQTLVSKDTLLQKTEQQCRDFQMIVDRLSAERDVWVRERELWWREREEIYRAVEALRMEVRQSQTENRRLREMAWTLWNDVGGRNGGSASEGDKPKESGATGKGDKGTEDAANNGDKIAQEGDDTNEGSEDPGADTESALPATPFADLGILANLAPRQSSNNQSNGPVSPTDIAHDLLALSRAASPSSRPAQPNIGTSTSPSSNALEDLKTRMSFWDAERENLYRAASDRERELLLSSLIPGAPPAAGMNLPGGGLNAMNAAQLFARMAAGLWSDQQQAQAQQAQQAAAEAASKEEDKVTTAPSGVNPALVPFFMAGGASTGATEGAQQMSS